MSVVQDGDFILMKHKTQLKKNQNSDYCEHANSRDALLVRIFYLENVIFLRQTQQDILQRWCYRQHSFRVHSRKLYLLFSLIKTKFFQYIYFKIKTADKTSFSIS